MSFEMESYEAGDASQYIFTEVSPRQNDLICSWTKSQKLAGTWLGTLSDKLFETSKIYSMDMSMQGCIFRLTCSHPELTEDHVLTSAYVKIFRTVTRNAVNKSV